MSHCQLKKKVTVVVEGFGESRQAGDRAGSETEVGALLLDSWCSQRKEKCVGWENMVGILKASDELTIIN